MYSGSGLGGRKSIILLERSKVSPARPADKGSVKVKILEWFQAVSRDRGRGVLYSELISNCII
jgi:hypothetical protein